MDLPRFKKGGGISLNGPHITGYAVKTVVYEGPGVVMGADVLIITTDPKLSAAIAEYLNDQEVSRCSHVVLGQKPWYQSEHRDYDLDDMFPTNPAPVGAPADPMAKARRVAAAIEDVLRPPGAPKRRSLLDE